MTSVPGRPGGASYWRSPTTKRIGGEASLRDRRTSPGLGSCARYRTSWAFVDSHGTNYTDCSGVSILCEECWAELTPMERVPFYRVWWEQTHWATMLDLDRPTYPYCQFPTREARIADSVDTWPRLLEAVLAGG